MPPTPAPVRSTWRLCPRGSRSNLALATEDAAAALGLARILLLRESGGMRDMNRDLDSFGWFLLGGVAGAVTALLLAPAEGKKTRRQLARRVRQGLDHATAASDELVASAGEIKDQVANLVERAEAFVDDAAHAASDAAAKLSR
jgi:gas vesicle protein